MEWTLSYPRASNTAPRPHGSCRPFETAELSDFLCRIHCVHSRQRRCKESTGRGRSGSPAAMTISSSDDPLRAPPLARD